MLAPNTSVTAATAASEGLARPVPTASAAARPAPAPSGRQSVSDALPERGVVDDGIDAEQAKLDALDVAVRELDAALDGAGAAEGKLLDHVGGQRVGERERDLQARLAAHAGVCVDGQASPDDRHLDGHGGR